MNTTIALTHTILQGNDSDSSDSKKEWGRSPEGKSTNIPSDFLGAYNMIINHYFSGVHSLYNKQTFKRRFSCQISVIERVYTTLSIQDPFILKTNRAGLKPGMRSMLNIIAALRMLKYGDSTDRLNNHLQLSETESSNTLKHCCRLVVSEFGDQYLNRPPNLDEKIVPSNY